MTEPLHVLVWGTAQEGPCAYYRGHLYDAPLAELGVEFRHINRVDFALRRPVQADDTLASLFAQGDLALDTTDIDWADVVLFRRYYNTAITCKVGSDLRGGCNFRTRDMDAALAHEKATPGHHVERQDEITRLLWDAFEASRDKAVVYDTDDLLIAQGMGAWNGYSVDGNAERDLIGRMLRRADLVTTTTPTLARYLRPYNANVRVIRNAIDPAMYVTDVARPEGSLPRLLFYGGSARLRDYAGFPDGMGKIRGGYAKAAVDDWRDYLHSIWLGADRDAKGAGAITYQWIQAMVDEVHPYVESLRTFGSNLAATHPDVGIAPLLGDDFDSCKSELHWLEYSAVGAATVAQRFPGGPDSGPYNVIRDGTDGLLAKGRQEWHDAVGALVRSPQLRADLAGAARERVMREYDYRVRAPEWADAFRWAAEHVGAAVAA